MGRRRRQAPAPEDTTETRTVETAPRTEASQQPLMPQERVEQHIETIEGIKAQQKKWNDQLKKAKEVIEAEGMNPKTILDAIKRKKEDPLKLRRAAEERAHVDRIIGLPFQMTIYDVAFESPVAQARAEARAAAAAGRPPENRWPEGSPECEAYREEYALKQASMVPGAGDFTDEEVAAAVREPRQMDIEDAPIVGMMPTEPALGMAEEHEEETTE